MEKYKHVFIDLDRTLWDFEMNAFDALSDIFIKFGLNNHYRDFDEFIGLYHIHNEKLWAQYREGNIKKDILRSKRFELTLNEKNISDKVLAEKIGDEYLETSVTKTKLFPNTFELLNYLKPKYPLYILTNGFRETQLMKLKTSKLEKFFDQVFTSETIGYNKPHIKIFQWAVSSVNAHKQECIMIGDDQEVDIKGANNYGIDSILFNPKKELITQNSKYTISDLIEIKEIL